MIRVTTMAAIAMIALLPIETFAEGREAIGRGRLVNNDLFGDTGDRWQTGSVQGSHVVGYGWDGVLPSRPFDILEYRLSGQVVAPANLRSPAAGDRPFAGVLNFGLHTHFQRGGNEISMGADLAITGPQNGLSALQVALHDGMGVTAASKAVTDAQIGDGVHPTLVSEAGRPYALGGTAVLRPFVEARWGLETMVRAGADLTIGAAGQGELMVRDGVTGQRYRTTNNLVTGMSYVIGADMAMVDSSVLLPEDRGYDLTETRNRVRAGMHWQGENRAVFYGVTYLSKEFEAQDEGQFVGSLRLDLNF